MFQADPEVLHDQEVDTGLAKVNAWFAKRDFGLELSFNRIYFEGLNRLLAKDRR